MRPLLLLALAVLLFVSPARAEEPASELLGWPLLLREDFATKESLSALAPSDPNAWRWGEAGGRTFADQFRQSQVKTPVRSPFNRAVFKDLVLTDTVLDVRLQSTARDYDHRSLCLFFGYQDPAHMYYVHFGKKTDDHANQIFLVNDAPRVKVSTKTTPGTPWDDEWHHARVVRTVETGEIRVYFDDMETPTMTAVDKTLQWGQVGIGSFDDTGRFDEVLVYGRKRETGE